MEKHTLQNLKDSKLPTYKQVSFQEWFHNSNVFISPTNLA